MAGHDRGPRRNRASPTKSARGAQRTKRTQQKKVDTLTLTQMAGGSADTIKKDEGPEEVTKFFLQLILNEECHLVLDVSTDEICLFFNSYKFF